MSLEKIYEKAAEAARINLDTYNKKTEKETKNITPEQSVQKEAGDGAKWVILKEMPEDNVVVSVELLNIVKDMGLTLLEYGKRTNINYNNEYEPVTEYYSVRYNDYSFIIKNLHGYDIEEGIFAVYHIINNLTGEKIPFFIDLGCRNTGDTRKEDFTLLINSNSEEEYLNKKYYNYNCIAEMLEEKGCHVLDNRLKFSSNSIKGYIKVDEKIYVIPYFAAYDDVRVVVCNCNNWDCNSSNSRGNIGYYIDYKSKYDIDKIIEAIEAMKLHVNNKFGFFENGNFYTNREIENVIDITNKKRNGEYPDAINFHQIRVHKVNQWDGRGYGDHRYISVLNGLEVAVHFSFEINNAAQWSKGDIVNYSDIVFKYDKREDDKNCILLINNYQYNYDEDITITSDDEDDEYTFEEIDKLYENLDKNYLIDSIEIRGGYHYLLVELIKYLNTMCEINNIDYTFEV